MSHFSDPTTQTAALSCEEIIGQSESIKTICEQAKQIAPTDCSVLIVGETGTGKGLISRRVYEWSARTNQPLITMNCATPPETTVEAELFGYHKKQLQGYSEPSLEHLSTVNGATLLIDEISELSEESQAHFLEVLELIERKNTLNTEPPINIRLIVTSQHDLYQRALENAFNTRLFYHLNVFTIAIPPLRDRGSDKISIAELLLKEACTKYQLPLKYYSSAATKIINSYQWPGNYRELRNTVERAVLLSQTELIDEKDLALDYGTLAVTSTTEKAPLSEPSATEADQGLSLEDYFQHFVLEHQEHMTETELAQKLGISRKCLWERRQRYNIPRRKSVLK